MLRRTVVRKAETSTAQRALGVDRSPGEGTRMFSLAGAVAMGEQPRAPNARQRVVNEGLQTSTTTKNDVRTVCDCRVR